MKIIKFILLIACILLFTSALALSEGFFTHSDEILFADQCPDGYQTVEKRLVLGQGETRVIANQAKYFGSHNHDIVAVSNDGVIQAVSPGRTVISVYLEYNVRKDLVAEVVKAPKTIRLSEKKGTLTIGGTHQLKPTITQSTATTITWTSSAPEIASVDANGLVTAHQAGECTITARTHNGLTAECAIKVKLPPPARIELQTDKLTVYMGETASILYTLNGGHNETVEWSSVSPAIAAVDENGVVTPVKTGKTTIRMKASGGDSKTISVTVKSGSTRVEFPVSEITQYVGAEVVFEPTITGGSGKYEYVSMDPSIASVDPQTGKIRAHREGSVYILAVTPNLTFGEFLLTIVEGPEEVALESDKTEILIGESITTRCSLDTLSGFEPLYTWYESTDEKIAHVDEYGVITGVKKGDAVISVHSGGLSAEIEISVLPPAKQIEAWAGRDKLGAGETTECFYTLTDGTGTVEYAYSDPQVAIVDPETGTIHALMPGTTEITLSVSKKVSDSFTITVLPAPKRIYVEKSHMTLACQTRSPFEIGIDEGALTTYTVTSSDPELVFYEDGFLQCTQKTGNATITVQTHNGLSAECIVAVIAMSDEIVMDANKLSLSSDFDYYILLSKGAAHDLNARIPSIPDLAFIYSSSHPDIASVSDTGLITAHKKGASLITVSLLPDCEVRVLVSVE